MVWVQGYGGGIWSEGVWVTIQVSLDVHPRVRLAQASGVPVDSVKVEVTLVVSAITPPSQVVDVNSREFVFGH